MDIKLKESMGAELYVACVEGDLDAVKTFISRSSTSTSSHTPPFSSMIYAAASKDRDTIVQFCLEHGAKVNPDIMKIIMISHAKKTYTLLLDRKAVEVDYYIPWFGDILSNAATHDDFEWARLCLSRGADPNKNLVDEHKSILAAVAELASVEMAQLLIEHGANVKGSGAIVMAAEEGKPDMVKLLLNKGADINEIGIEHPTDPRFKEDMGTALHRAVEAGHSHVVEYLVNEGADVNAVDPMNRKPVGLAKARKDNAIINMLRENSSP